MIILASVFFFAIFSQRTAETALQGPFQQVIVFSLYTAF
jgi:hypothetical protein